MAHRVLSPPESVPRPDGTYAAGWWHTEDDSDRLVCDLCPRACRLKPGDRGFCFVRENRGGEMLLTTYGRSTGFCIDPIEKKPLHHFYPGSSVLSFGTAGCNLGCKFCQNWDSTKSREVDRATARASASMIAQAAQELGCRSVAYTYNDPVIWSEYASDVAKACRERDICSVAVTAGYILPPAREAFFSWMDAANVDLKAITEEFYWRYTYAHLNPVLDTIGWLKRETDVWLELTNLVIPGANDAPDELRRLCDWILESVGDEVPIHFSAFHPDFRLTDRPATPHATLQAAYRTAREAGLRYVYLGNVNDVEHQSTYCATCGELLIERDWYELGQYRLRESSCPACQAVIPGRFAACRGAWGRQRLPVDISRFAGRPLPPVANPERLSAISTPFLPSEQPMKTTPDSSGPSAEVSPPPLSAEQQQAIHHGACEIVAAKVLGRELNFSDPRLAGAERLQVMGAFVTAKRQGQLRGCCGVLGRPFTVSESVLRSASRTATEDTRMPPISPTELPYLDISVTLLHNFQPILARGTGRIGEVVIGKHGLQIQRGPLSGLLLPVVAVEHELTPEQFLQHVCRKAGLPASAWLEDDVQLQTFEGLAIQGPFDPQVWARVAGTALAATDPYDVGRLAEHCRQNLALMRRGATPNYYLAGGADGTVAGAAISLTLPHQEEPLHFVKLALRPGLPLQATLFELTQAAAKSLARVPAEPAAEARLDVTLLTDVAMHGMISQCDLAGFDPVARAILVIDNLRTAWVYDPKWTVEQLLDEASERARIVDPSATRVYSVRISSTAARVAFSSGPQPHRGASVRPPAIAGTFYPADPVQLGRLVDDCLNHPATTPSYRPAVLVPHAGLRYSGRIAGQVLRSVAFPPSIIILAPKHTAYGAAWAVAPHEYWEIPGARIAADVPLAELLAAHVTGLELDAAAHKLEHAVEIQLPLLARVAPESRVVGVVVGGGSLARCQQFGDELAEVLRPLTPRPLLMISSDLNHFASDEENRRLDEIALQAIEHLDPAHVYRTVVDHSISMCGLLPAVVAMQALQSLGQLHHVQRVAYATSGDITGDHSRVVGYAGLIFA